MDFPKSVPGVGLVDGQFVDEDPVVGRQGSVIPSVWGNAVTHELLNVIAAAGLEPDEAQSDQLLQAIVEILSRCTFAPVNFRASATGIDAFVKITADRIALENAAGKLLSLRNVGVTINTAAVGINGLDTGALAASTWYSKWVISNGTEVAGLISLSANAPTLPADYTFKKRTGWIRTDASANKFPLSFIQAGTKSAYVVGAGKNVASLPALAAGVSGDTANAVYTAVSVSGVVPPTAKAIDLVIGASDATPNTAMAAPTLGYGGYAGNAASPPPLCISLAGGNGRIRQCGTFMLASANVYYSADHANAFLRCMGWEDSL